VFIRKEHVLLAFQINSTLVHSTAGEWLTSFPVLTLFFCPHYHFFQLYCCMLNRWFHCQSVHHNQVLYSLLQTTVHVPSVNIPITFHTLQKMVSNSVTENIFSPKPRHLFSSLYGNNFLHNWLMTVGFTILYAFISYMASNNVSSKTFLRSLTLSVCSYVCGCMEVRERSSV